MTVTRDPELYDPVSWSGGVSRGCAWDETVCPTTPTWRITEADGSASAYCTRHLVLTVVLLVEAHLPTCGTWSDHVESIDPLD